MNSEGSRDEIGRKWPYSRASAQVRLAVDMYAAEGIELGVQMNGDEVDFVYEEGALLVRDSYLEQVRAVVGGGGVMDGLMEGVTHYSLAGAKMTGVNEALTARFLGGQYVLITQFLLIIVILLIRPRGIAGILDKAREA